MTYLITGATGGLGRELARRLAQAGVQRLILPVRSERSGAALRAQIAAAGCSDVSTPLLDLASLASVQRFIEHLKGGETNGSLQGLLLNAGIQSAGQLRFTEDGIESTFAVNHLASYALFKGFSELLSDEAIVGWTSSGTHDPNLVAAKIFGFRGAQYETATLLAEGKYSRAKSVAQSCRDAYATSKFCNLLMARHFGALERGKRRFFSFEPGLMPGTGLAREQGRIGLAAWNHVLPYLVPILPGASTPARSAEVLAELLQGKLSDGKNGSYFNYTGHVVPSYASPNEAAIIEDLVGTSDALLEQRRIERRINQELTGTSAVGHLQLA